MMLPCRLAYQATTAPSTLTGSSSKIPSLDLAPLEGSPHISQRDASSSWGLRCVRRTIGRCRSLEALLTWPSY